MDQQNISQTESFNSLRDQLLIAMPSLSGSEFEHSVIYICEHTPEGAMGLVINTPLDISLQEVFAQFDLSSAKPVADKKVFSGGPVSVNHGFVLHQNCARNWENTLQISDRISLTTSRDIVVDLAYGKGPENALLILGYSGWGAGQLESEILENAWLTVPSDPELLFETASDQCAIVAGQKAGIDLSKISLAAGHA